MQTTKFSQKLWGLFHSPVHFLVFIVSLSVFLGVLFLPSIGCYIDSHCLPYGPYPITPSVFSDLVSWFPLANKVSQGDFFPATMTINGSGTGWGIFPYISLWIHGGLIKLFGVSLSYIIGRMIFSILIFYLVLRLFNRHLNILWSVTLTFLTRPLQTLDLFYLMGKYL